MYYKRLFTPLGTYFLSNFPYKAYRFQLHKYFFLYKNALKNFLFLILNSTATHFAKAKRRTTQK